MWIFVEGLEWAAPAAMKRKALPASLRANLFRGSGTTSPLAIPAASSACTSHAYNEQSAVSTMLGIPSHTDAVVSGK